MATDQEIHADAMERFKDSQDASSFNRNDAEADIRFARLADQWPDDVRKIRIKEGRPCLTINRLPSFIRQVVNESRQNKPGISVHPVDNGADEKTAEIIGGIIRSVERSSKAEIAYDTAIDHAVTSGFGFFRINLDYAHSETFDLEARIQRIPNPLQVHWDTNSTEFDASDWDFAFVSEFLSEDQFKFRYPDAAPVSFEGDRRDYIGDWLQSGLIRVSEYWLREDEKRKLFLLSDGNAVREAALPRIARESLAAGGITDLGGQVDDDEVIAAFLQMNGLTVAREREVTDHTITRRIMSGEEVLEEDPWPGSMIPICPVWGDEVIVDGRRHFRSMVRDAKDSQAMFNFWRSASTELVALAPKAPFVIDDRALPKDTNELGKWNTANTRSHPYLIYNGQGNVPQRQAMPSVPTGAIQEALNAADDMKSILGIYDAALGARGNETSGLAIRARQRESDVSNFHFIDNLNRAIEYAGRVLVDIIPAVYSTRQTIRILGEDQKENVVRLTQESVAEGGDGDLYNIAVGKYDVAVKSGPSYATQREETKEFLIEIISRLPEAAMVLGDILLDYMDFPRSDEAAERLRTLAVKNGIIPPDGSAVAGQPQPVAGQQAPVNPAALNGGLQ